MGKIVTKDQIGWASYREYEGAFFWGQYRPEIPENPDFWDKVAAVISSTEGNCDSANLYDRCICSISFLQLCDAGFFMSTKLLGEVAEKLGIDAVKVPLAEALKSSNATFIKDPKFGWRFKFLDQKGLVNTANLQRELYLKGTGLKGSWTPETKDHNKTWAAGLANVWHDPKARAVQFQFIKGLLPNYTTPTVKKELFDPKLKGIWVEIAQAIYTSFAANLPAEAAKQYLKFKEETKLEPYTKEWVLGLTKQLTFGPKITIYPQRYSAIRPTIEKLWGVELPKSPKELQDHDIPKPIELDPVEIVVDMEVPPTNEPSKDEIKPDPPVLPTPTPSPWVSFLGAVLKFLSSLFGGLTLS